MPGSPEQPSAAPATRRLHAIEIARGLACGAVLLFHSLTALPPDSLHPALRFVRRFTEHGWLGVHVFFAVSGWCIAERLAAARRRDEPVFSFLRERALRIYPAYWAALAALLAVRAAALPFNTTPLAGNLPAGAAGWLGDVLLLQPYLGSTSALVVSWSLVYELGFYALGAGALLLRGRGLSATALIGLGLLLMLPTAFGWLSRPIYVLGLWPDFFAGVLAWRAARPGMDAAALFSAAALLALFALAAILSEKFGGAGRLVALGTAAVLWFASRHDPVLARRRPLRALAWLGGISYSLYLIHVTVLSPFTNLSLRFVRPDRLGFCALWLTGVGLALVAGWALHRWVEAPIERWRKRRWSHRPVVA